MDSQAYRQMCLLVEDWQSPLQLGVKPDAMFTRENADVHITLSKQSQSQTMQQTVGAQILRSHTTCSFVDCRSLLPLLFQPLFRLHFYFLLLPTRACDCTFTRLALALATLHHYLYFPDFEPLTPLPTLSTHNTALNTLDTQHHKPSTAIHHGRQQRLQPCHHQQ
jgi:hypothetical protein